MANGHVNAMAIAEQAGDGGDSLNGDYSVQTDNNGSSWLPGIASLFEDLFDWITGSGGSTTTYPPDYFVFQKRLTFKRH